MANPTGRGGRTPTPPLERPIPKKQQVFLHHYLIGDNGKPLSGKEAAMRAGYPAASASGQATWILSRPNVQVYLKAKQAAIAERHDITLDMIVKELAKVGFSNMADYIEDDGSGKPVFKKLADIRRDHMAAVTELTVDVRKEFEGRGEDREHVGDVEKIKFKLASKIEGLVNLGRLLGHFPRGEGGPEGDGNQEARTVTIRVIGGLPQPERKED